MTQPNLEIVSPRSSPQTEPSPIRTGHTVQFYENDEFLAAAVADFLAEGLERGENVIVIATEEHRTAFSRRLSAKGINVELATRLGQLTPLDAVETLRMFMLGGVPDRARFREAMEAVLGRHRRNDGTGGIRLFGEMVDVLWREGNTDGAIRLEGLWNELGNVHAFNLLCAYSMGNFYKATDAEKLRDVCEQHSHVLPAIWDARADERKDAADVADLETRARALEAEIEHRKGIEERLRQALLGAQRAEEALRRNERELTDFFENSPLPLDWVGPDGIIVRANQAELDLLGYARDEYVGHHIGEFHVDRAAIEDVLARLERGEIVRSFEARLRCRDGATKDVLIDANVRWGPNGEFAHARCFTRDITERNRSDELSARLAAIVSSSDDAIIAKTLDGVIKSWNRGAERIFGYTAAEAIGQHISLIIPKDRLSEEDGVLARLRRGERIDHFETVRRAKDGSQLYISLTVSPIKDSKGNVIGASKVARDVTESVRGRKMLEDALADAVEARSAADSANRAKAEFLAAMSHELRTPLNAISGYVQLLQMGVHGPVTKGQQEALRRTEKSQQHLLSLINDVLNFAKIEAGKVNYDVEDVILGDVVNEVWQMMEQQFAAKQLRYQTSIDTQLVVRADQEKLRQILINLLTNAAKFTPSGGEVTLHTRTKKGTAALVVSDTGPGIPADKRDKVFDPFVQVHRSLSERLGGVGLGLAISRDLARGMGGDLTLDESEVGATFVVTLRTR